jgi:hypothetical protein
MEYKIDKKNFRIELKGSKKEIRKFARRLVEIVDKNLLREFESLKFGKEAEQFNVNAYQRLYLSRDSLIYIPNVGDNPDIKKIHFAIMEEKYEKAKKNFSGI